MIKAHAPAARSTPARAGPVWRPAPSPLPGAPPLRTREEGKAEITARLGSASRFGHNFFQLGPAPVPAVPAEAPIQAKKKRRGPPPAVSPLVNQAADHLRNGRIHEMATTMLGATAAQTREFNAHLDRSGLRQRYTRATNGVPSGRGSGRVDFRNATGTWSDDEVGQVETAFSMVPADHLHGLGGVHRWRRAVQPVGAADTEGGESFTANGRMRLYNHGATGNFGATLPDSALAGHDRTQAQGPAGQPNPGQVRSLEYTATHELGHFVSASKAAAFQNFKTAAGYEDVAPAAVAGRLAAYDGAAAHLLANPQAGVTVGAHNFRAHPTLPGQFLGRVLGGVPPGAVHNYARTQPGEHFAELYAQMVHAPEMAHRDYVTAPQPAVAAARQALAAHDAMRANRSYASQLWNVRSDAATRQGLQNRLDEANTVLRARQGAHRVMRQQVFGLTDAVVAGKRRELRGRNRRILARRQAYFDAHQGVAATPQQLAEVHRQAMRVN